MKVQTTKQYLEDFFFEKETPDYYIDVEIDGIKHSVPVLDMILNHAPKEEQEKIAHTLRRIDFLNGDVDDYLKFLARAFILTQTENARL